MSDADITAMVKAVFGDGDEDETITQPAFTVKADLGDLAQMHGPQDDEIRGPIVDAILMHEDEGNNELPPMGETAAEEDMADDPAAKVFINIEIDNELEEFLDTIADSYPLGSDAFRVCSAIRFLVHAPWQEDEIDMIRDLARAKAILDDLLLGYLDEHTGEVIGVPTSRICGRRS